MDRAEQVKTTTKHRAAEKFSLLSDPAVFLTQRVSLHFCFSSRKGIKRIILLGPSDLKENIYPNENLEVKETSGMRLSTT